jgi:hypothetical protein
MTARAPLSTLSLEVADVLGVEGWPTAKDGGSRHKDVSTSFDRELRGLPIYASINLQLDLPSAPVDQVPDLSHLGELGLNEALSSKPRIDRHHQNQINIAQNRLYQRNR